MSLVLGRPGDRSHERQIVSPRVTPAVVGLLRNSHFAKRAEFGVLHFAKSGANYLHGLWTTCIRGLMHA